MDLFARKQLPLFSIGIVQKLTGLTARQIRYYEQHGLVTPVRSEGNQRLFSFLDVERLMEIRRLLDDGFSMNEVKQQFRGEPVKETEKNHPSRQPEEPSDQEIFKLFQKETLEGPVHRTNSFFQGDLSRFYRKKWALDIHRNAVNRQKQTFGNHVDFRTNIGLTIETAVSEAVETADEAAFLMNKP